MKSLNLKHIINLSCFFVLSLLPFLACATLPTPIPTIPNPPAVAAKSYLLMDYDSGYLIAEQNVDAQVEPASLTKMMTIYVADQAIKEGRIKETDLVKISEKAWKTDGSRMFLDVNSEVPIAELMKGIIIQSGNDASVALAEHIAGSESAFADLMNFCAQQLGMTKTHFMNATGLPDPNHYTTARDMAILGKAVIRDFPKTYALYAEKEFTYKNIHQTNRNRLLWRNQFVDGIKTGHTESAGFCLVGSAKKGSTRFISVVMGTENDKVRTEESDKLLSYGLHFYESRKLYSGATPLKQARIWMGKDKEIPVGLANDVYVTIGQGQYAKLKATIEVNKNIKAPATIGTELGTLIVELDNKILVKHPIVALQTVEAAGIFGRLYDKVALTFQNLWDKTVS